jgi:hypothetical protein
MGAAAQESDHWWVERDVLMALNAGPAVEAAGGQRTVIGLQACRSLTPSITS